MATYRLPEGFELRTHPAAESIDARARGLQRQSGTMTRLDAVTEAVLEYELERALTVRFREGLASAIAKAKAADACEGEAMPRTCWDEVV